MDKQMIELLIKDCASDDPTRQISAIQELSDNKIYDAIPILLQLITSPSSTVRSTVAEALGYLGVHQADLVGPALLTLITDPDHFVRDDAIQSLGRIQYLPAGKAIAHQLLNDSEWIVRAPAAEALGYLGNSDSLEVLKEAFANDKEETVRGWAIHSIGILGNKDVLPFLASQLGIVATENTKVDILVSRYRLGSRDDLKVLLDMSTTNDNMLIYNMVNRFENLLKFKNPPTLVEDASDIQKMLLDIVKRFPVLQAQVDDMVNNLILIGSKKS